jgi:glucose-1-phosphate thymidylyltransferase
MPAWGLIPAAGAGSRIQPLAFSKELLPVGSRLDHGVERPRAVSEYLVERLLRGGATRLCFVIGPGKSDIVSYYGANVGGAPVCYTVQPHPAGLCDAVFRIRPFLAPDDDVLVGLPDTVWFPGDGLARLAEGRFSFLLFPVEQPQFFDAVVADDEGTVQRVDVKQPSPGSSWIWGAFRLPAGTLGELHDLWLARGERDEYLGTLVNAYIDAGGRVGSVPAGESYVDVGTLGGYRRAIQLLANPEVAEPQAG